MSSGKILPRRQAVPVLYTRGTHYEVGFDMVSTPQAAYQPLHLRIYGLSFTCWGAHDSWIFNGFRVGSVNFILTYLILGEFLVTK